MLTEAASRQDVLGVEIFANLFNAIVDEMAWIVLRSSHTTFVKETQDFAVALVTPEGDMFAYPYGRGATPIMGVNMQAGTQAATEWEAGDVLITDATNSRVQKLTPDGLITTVAGGTTAGFDGDGGPAWNALLNAPFAVTTDARGNVIVVDTRNNRIRLMQIQ